MSREVKWGEEIFPELMVGRWCKNLARDGRRRGAILPEAEEKIENIEAR